MVWLVKLSITLSWKRSPYSRYIVSEGHFREARKRPTDLLPCDERSREDTVDDNRIAGKAIGGDSSVGDSEVGDRPNGRVSAADKSEGNERGQT